MTYLSVYKIIFMTELLIAETMFVWRFPKRNKFALRVLLSLLVCYAVAVFYPLIGTYSWFSSSAMFLILFAVTIPGLFFCFKTPLMNMLFIAVIAYTVQHFSYEIFNLINIILLNGEAFTSRAYGSDAISLDDLWGTNGLGAIGFVIYLFVYVAVYFSSDIVLKKRVGQSTNLKFKHTSIVIFAVFVLIVNVVISAVSQYAPAPEHIIHKIIPGVYNVLCCLTIFYIQMSMVKTKDVEREMEVLAELFNQYQKHYKIQAESITLINQKCHDFKHQIRTFASRQGIADEEATKELQNLISIYDTNIKTGNDALDIILTEKNLLCHKNGITLTCMAEGDCVSFMSNGEVYALFGNILDNAIEAVSKISDDKKRCINLHLTRRDDLIVIRTDNYFVGKLNLDADGLPRTTKGDENYHGFGMRSIQALVHKYEGFLYVTAEENVFCLSIVIPDNFS